MRTCAVGFLVLRCAVAVHTAATADTATVRGDFGRMTYAPPDEKLLLVPYEVADVITSKAMTRDEKGQPRSGEQGLIELITAKIAWKSWSCHVGGGKGTIDYFPLGCVLVINQTPEVHRRIEKLLRDLRKQASREE